MKFFSSRKPVYLNFAFLFLFLGCWLFSYMFPVVKGLFQFEDYQIQFRDNHVFYGTVTRASIPSIFGGTDIPFFDKTTFQINGDGNVNFVLYASQELLDDMSDWFSFASKDAGSIPLEITAARVSDDCFVVHAISSAEGDLEYEDLVVSYQFYWLFLGVFVVAGLDLLALVLFILWLVKKRR